MSYRIVLVTLLAVSTAHADTIYVDDDNCPGPGSGTEGDPYCSIQTAIDNAVDTDEIVVAPGTYFETINFLGKAITLRSSDGAEVTTIDALGTGRVVVCTSGEGLDTVFDGFTITGGISTSGGGMFTGFGSSPTVTNCKFSGNSASREGGGMYNSGKPTLTNCIFVENTALSGGGMYNSGSAKPTVTNCTFSGNTASFTGGGMVNHDYADPTVTNCTFSGNSANLGGGISNELSSPTVANCVFSGNVAAERGGGMWNVGFSAPTVENCLFSGNMATEEGGGMWNGGSLPTVTNCILWQDSPDEIGGGATPTVTYSDVQGGWPGTGNIDADPLFVDPDNGDYRLSAGSPCIDAGHNWAVPPDAADLDADGDTAELTPFDLDGNPRFVHASAQHPGCGVPAVVDMGAYEFPDGKAADVKLGDIDGNGVVEILDFLVLLVTWGPCVDDCCLPDLDLDGDVGIDDFLAVIANWG